MPRCAECGYDLQGLPSARCPECGHVHAPAVEAHAAERWFLSRRGLWLWAPPPLFITHLHTPRCLAAGLRRLLIFTLLPCVALIVLMIALNSICVVRLHERWLASSTHVGRRVDVDTRTSTYRALAPRDASERLYRSHAFRTGCARTWVELREVAPGDACFRVFGAVSSLLAVGVLATRFVVGVHVRTSVAALSSIEVGRSAWTATSWLAGPFLALIVCYAAGVIALALVNWEALPHNWSPAILFGGGIVLYLAWSAELIRRIGRGTRPRHVWIPLLSGLGWAVLWLLSFVLIFATCLVTMLMLRGARELTH